MEIFRELAVKVKGLDDCKGTGCIYELSRKNKKKYILTAQHCLTSNSKKREFNREEMSHIEIYDFSGNRFYISNIYIPKNPDIDFAVIETSSNHTYSSIVIRNPERNMSYTFFGFPNYLKDDVNPGEPLEGYIVEVNDIHFTLQHQNGTLSDEDGDAKDNTIGFSGSGIYFQEEGNYYLVGILVRLRSDGKHGRLIGINIMEINTFLFQKELDILVPYELNDFTVYLELILQEEDDKFKPVLNKQFKDSFSDSDIKPSYIHQKLEAKLFLPYDRNGNILNHKLWEGWLRFLLYISLYKGEILDLNNINNHIYIEEPNISRSRFFYTEEKRMATFVTHLYDEPYKDIHNNDLIFVNSEKFKGSKLSSFSEIHQIIQSIDNPFMYESGIDITNPNELKKVKVIHLDYLIDQIENVLITCITSQKNTKQIEEACTKCLKKLFQEFGEVSENEREDVPVEVDS